MKIEEFTDNILKISNEQIERLKETISKYNEIIILGNGGSSAIASHISQDYTKKLGKRSFCFSDPSRLTCYINDYGMEEAYKVFLENFSSKNSLVVLISSSGESKNIINCAKFCVQKNISYIILTGFEKDNHLRKNYANNSILDFWVNSKDYGVVECIHQTFLHIPA